MDTEIHHDPWYHELLCCPILSFKAQNKYGKGWTSGKKLKGIILRSKGSLYMENIGSGRAARPHFHKR